MSIALPLAGLILAALAVFLSASDESRPRLSSGQVLAVATLAILGCAMAPWPSENAIWVCIGALLGALVALLAALGRVNMTASTAVGAGSAMLLHLLPSYGVPSAQAALLALVGLGAVITGAYPAALGALIVVALDSFGRLYDKPDSLSMAGSLAAVLLILAAMPAQSRKVTSWTVPALGGLLILLLYFVPSFVQPVATTLLLGVAGAVLLNLLLPSDAAGASLSIGLGTLISVGLATAAYALSRGTGMAACLLGSMGVLLLLQNPRAVLALGPLFGLVLFRLLRNLHPETTRAFDIGQHYALIGLLFGAILPLLLIDGLGFSAQAGKKQPFALLILAILCGVVAPLLAMFLGPIGVVGFVVGLGFAGLLEVIRQGTSLLALSAGVGMSGVLFSVQPMLRNSVDLARDEKIRLLVWATVGILVASATFTLLTRKVKE